MQVEISIKVNGRIVEVCAAEISGTAEDREEQSQALARTVAQPVAQHALQEYLDQQKPLRCCHRPMHQNGKSVVRPTTLAGKIKLVSIRWRCSNCGSERSPVLEETLCGPHRVSRPLARRICRLAIVEHFTRLPELVHSLSGVSLSHDQLQKIVQTVGTAAEKQRLAEVRLKKERLASGLRLAPPPAEIRPRRVYVSCDGIMYCTNLREPDPQQPGKNRLIWQQMKVGCVYWQDENERWHKRMTWGRESPEDFGQSLYFLACRCGYREAGEKVFAADGGEWCWRIQANYFGDAVGILDWYHASEHVHQVSKVLHSGESAQKEWANLALAELKLGGAEELLAWLREEVKGQREKKRKSLQGLIGYVSTRFAEMDYPEYRLQGYQIGSGMIESTAKQLVGQRLKGCGMRWSETGALAVTALRAISLNGSASWSKFWANLALAA